MARNRNRSDKRIGKGPDYEVRCPRCNRFRPKTVLSADGKSCRWCKNSKPPKENSSGH